MWKSLKVEIEPSLPMRAGLAVPLALLFLSVGMWGWANPEEASSWFDEVITNEEDSDVPMLKMQPKEEWLVVVVDFLQTPAAPGLDINQAENILMGTNGVTAYVDEMSDGKVELNITIHPEVVRAEHPVEYYGTDADGTRDVGQAGGNGPSTLAEQVIMDIKDSIDWQQWDLNNDGIVDRFLILHTSKPQEDSGSSSKIWSHFGPLSEEIELPDDMIIGQYTIASFRSTNYRGTIIHESLHQHGAIDLYAVHDDNRKDPWNGVGDWDVMASGNWNGNGAVPSLPMAATIELLGIDRHQELPENWPEYSDCTGEVYAVSAQTSSGDALKIRLSEGEYLWAEYRADSGFDSQLPGEGLLVSILNENVGGLENNDANTDSRRPYLRVVEADQDNGLISGTDEGASSDVFQVDDQFGRNGVLIRDRFGFLVPWTATIEYNIDGILLNMTSENCRPSFDVSLPDESVVVFPNQGFNLTWTSQQDCTPSLNISSTDGRSIGPAQTLLEIKSGESYPMELKWNSAAVSGHKGMIFGQLSCGAGASYDIEIRWHAVGNIPTATTYTATVPYAEDSFISIPLEIIGDGTRQYSFEIEGALSRITSSPKAETLSSGDELELIIVPSGLLTPGMLARGTVILVDNNGLEYQINVTLTADSQYGSSGVIETLRDPGTMILIVGVLCAVWILLGIKRNPPPQVVPQPVIAQSADDFAGFGPPLDNLVAADDNSF